MENGRDARNGRSRLDLVLDTVGLLFLGWLLLLWYIGTQQSTMLVQEMEPVPRSAVRQGLTLALIVTVALLAVVVLLSFGRPHRWRRWPAAVPLVAVLLGTVAWRFSSVITWAAASSRRSLPTRTTVAPDSGTARWWPWG